eukprot:g13042.t1
MKPNEKKKLPNENNVQSSNAKKMRNYNSKAAGTKRAASNTFFTVDNMKVYHKKSRKVTTLTNFDVAKQHGWGDGENAYKKNLYKQTLLKACMESRFEDVKTLITEHANEDFEGTILNEEHLCHIINGKTRDSNLTDVQVDIVEYLLQHVVTIHPRDSQAKNELDTAITNTRRPFGGFSQQMNKNFVSKWSYKTSALLAAFDKVLHIEDNQLPANVQSIITDVQVDMIEYLLEHVVTMRPQATMHRSRHSARNTVSDSSHSREISYSDVVSALGNVLKNELSANAQRLIKNIFA